MDAAEALALALAKNSRGLHGVLAAEQAQLAPVAVASGAARAVRGGTDLQAALVLCFTTRTSKISLEERQSNRHILKILPMHKHSSLAEQPMHAGTSVYKAEKQQQAAENKIKLLGSISAMVDQLSVYLSKRYDSRESFVEQLFRCGCVFVSPLRSSKRFQTTRFSLGTFEKDHLDSPVCVVQCVSRGIKPVF